jgi:adenine-specific DNA-methyltransferase
MKKRDYSEWTKEDLVKEVESLKKQKTYGLVWEKDKTQEIFDYYINWDGVKNEERFPESDHKFPVLKELKEKEIITKLGDNYHILIEGDNFHSLAVLNFTHSKSVDVIYIDPPYNTGNKDFKYNDQWIDAEDSYKHSKWLSFMEKRLKLARELLKEKGIIFISIDDHEQAQLKILCDEIFGEENFIETIVWKKRATPPNDRAIGRIHEYIHVYGKTKEYNLGLLPRDEKSINRYSNPDNDPRGPWVASDLNANGKGGRLVRSCIYPIKNPDNKKEYLPSEGKCWLFNKNKMNEFIQQGRIGFRKNTGAPFLKRYLQEVRQGVTLPTILLEHGFSAHSSAELENLLGAKDFFEYPKPLKLIETLLRIATKKDSIVLDFMAGTGTTGNAVLNLNKEDNGKRRFILCTNNENEICSKVCYPRIKNVIKGYKNLKSEHLDGVEGNLKYFKTDFVDSAPTDKNKKKIVDKSVEMICMKENAFIQVKEKKEWKIFKNEEYYLGIIFDEEYIEDFVKEAKKINEKMHVYVFSLDENVPTKEFKDIKNKVKLCPIPEVILHVYRRIFKDD